MTLEALAHTGFLAAGFLVALAASAFFSGFETAFYTASRLRLRSRASRGDPGARTLQRLARDPDTTLATVLLGNNLVNFAATSLGVLAAAALGLGAHAAEAVVTATVGPIIFVAGELLPKTAARIAAERWAYAAAPWMFAVRAALSPLAVPLGFLTRALARAMTARAGTRSDPARSDPTGKARLDAILVEGAGRGIVTPRQREMTWNVLRADRRRVRDVMVPWERVAWMGATQTAESVRRGPDGAPYARYPVVSGDGQVLGIAHLLDLAAPNAPRGEDVARPAVPLRPDQTVLAALLTLQRWRVPIAVVREAGRPAGIVTAKDLVEEIVGEREELRVI